MFATVATQTKLFNTEMNVNDLDFVSMTSAQRKELFKAATDHLQLAGYTNPIISHKLMREKGMSHFNEKRIINLRSVASGAKPKIIEMRTLYRVFSEQLETFNPDQATDTEQKVMDLEAKFKELEERQKYFEDFLIKRMIDFKEEKTVRGDKD